MNSLSLGPWDSSSQGTFASFTDAMVGLALLWASRRRAVTSAHGVNPLEASWDEGPNSP